jgi:large-conductance mechanosensitive channel
MDIVNTWWGVIHDGILHIKPLQGAIIGILFGLLANSFGAVLVAPLLGAAAYVAVDGARPMLSGKPFAMPVFDTPLWHLFLSLYVAFLVIAAVIFTVRSIVSVIRG